MATIYLHIGIMKTGTSAIQNFLVQNQEMLEKNGYLYPKIDIGLPTLYQLRNGHFLIYKDDNLKKKKAAWENGWKEVRKLLATGKNLILSDESIWYRQNWELWDGLVFWESVQEELKNTGYDLKVIAYLRRQDDFVQSYWNTAVKGDTRTKLTFEEYIDKRRYEMCELDYYKQIQYMRQFLKEDQIIVRCYEKQQYEGVAHTLLSDFMQSIGLTLDDSYEPLQCKANPALDGNYVEIKRIMNQVELYPPLNNFLRYSVKSASAASSRFGEKTEKTDYFSPQGKQEFMAQYEEGNRKLASEILHREDGVLFYAPVVDHRQWEVDKDRMCEDIIRVVGEIACRQYKENQKLSAEIASCRQTLEKYNQIAENNFLLRWVKKRVAGNKKQK